VVATPIVAYLSGHHAWTRFLIRHGGCAGERSRLAAVDPTGARRPDAV